MPLTISGAGNTEFNSTQATSAITGAGGLTMSGTGTLTITSADNYTTSTTISSGTVNIQSTTALGATANTTSIAASGDLQLQGTVAFANSGAITVAPGGTIENLTGTNSISSPIILTKAAGQAANFNVDSGSLNLTGLISDSSAGTGTLVLTKGGAGQLTLTPTVANTFAGGATITAGVVSINAVTSTPANAALGTTGTVTVNSGATLQLNPGAAIALPNPLNLSGAGFYGTGAVIHAAGQNASLTGAITLSGPTAIADNALAANTLTLTSTATINSGGTSNSLTKLGSGTLTIQSANSNFTSSLIIGNNEEYVGNVTPGVVDIGGAAGAG